MLEQLTETASVPMIASLAARRGLIDCAPQHSDAETRNAAISPFAIELISLFWTVSSRTFFSASQTNSHPASAPQEKEQNGTLIESLDVHLQPIPVPQDPQYSTERCAGDPDHEDRFLGWCKPGTVCACDRV